MRFVRLALVCFLCAKFVTATAIVAAIFPDAIYIAADSRLTKTDAAGAPDTGSPDAHLEGCKIVQTPVAVFAVAALEADSATGFDFGAIAKQALAASDGPLSTRIDAVEMALAPKMKTTIEAVRKDFPDLYETFRMGYLGQAVFAAWEDGHPVLIEDDWKITPRGDLRQERFHANDEMNLVILGSGGDAILRYVGDNPDWWMFPAPEALKRLIQAAIGEAENTHTGDVGGEISVLMIDSRGRQWVNPGKCGDKASN